MSREAISWSEAAVSTSRVISPASSSRIESRSFRVHAILGLLGFFDDDAVLTVVLSQAHGDGFAARGRQVLADVVRAYRDLAVAALDATRQLDRGRPAQVDDRVEGGSDGAAGDEDVVHQDHRLVLDREPDVGAPHHRAAAHAEGVSIQADVEPAAASA